MNRRYLWIAVAAIAAGTLLGWVLLTGGQPEARRAVSEDVAELPTPTPAPEQRIILLFAGADGMLHPELRSVPLPEEIEPRLQMVMRELLAGPTKGLRPVIPYDAVLRAAFVDLGQHHAFIDITPPPDDFEGSHNEIMLAYGVVNSVLLNCPELNAVQLLFGGEEITTLTGHVDLSRPLPLNKRFIAAS